MNKLAKDFMAIIETKKIQFTPRELRIVKQAIRAIESWEEEQSKSCFGCCHLGDSRYNCNACARFGHVDYYFNMTNKE